MWLQTVQLNSKGEFGTQDMGYNFSHSFLQFVIFKPLSYCFQETIVFDVKASFASRPESRLIR